MRLEELLKKEGLSSSEISELLYRINTEKQDDEKKIDMYNRAIQEASRLGIEELYKLYKEIGNYKLTEEEKKLLQGNITFYIKEQKNMTKANIQQMLYFISTERQEDEKKIDLYNTALFEASKFGVPVLHSIYKDIKNYKLTEEEKKLLQGNVTFYIGEQKDMSPEDVKEMLYFVNAERIKDNTEFKVKEIAKIENSLDEKKIELYNKALFEASKLGSEVLEKIKNEIGSYNLTDEEKVLLQRNVDFYISEQQKNSTNTIESSAGRDR